MRIQDELEPHLLLRGFTRKNKRFLGASGELAMVVSFNPDVRIRRLRTIDVICVFPASQQLVGDYPEGTFYVYSQAYAASGNWRFVYEEGVPRWPRVIVDDFLARTVPFIDAATSREAVVRLLLDGSAPPEEPKQRPLGTVFDAYRIAREIGSEELVSEVVRHAEQLELNPSERERLLEWSVARQLTLELPAAVPLPRGTFGRLFGMVRRRGR